jgi:hypothetical protein
MCFQSVCSPKIKLGVNDAYALVSKQAPQSTPSESAGLRSLAVGRRARLLARNEKGAPGLPPTRSEETGPETLTQTPGGPTLLDVLAALGGCKNKLPGIHSFWFS